jgi:hypothetical protein
MRRKQRAYFGDDRRAYDPARLLDHSPDSGGVIDHHECRAVRTGARGALRR